MSGAEKAAVLKMCSPRWLVLSLLRWIVVGLAAWLASGAALALTAEQARALVAGEAETRIAALNAVLPNADEKTVALIQAIADDAVKYTDDAVYVMKDGKGYDPVTGAEVKVQANAEDVVNNNLLRSELDTALAAITLSVSVLLAFSTACFHMLMPM